MRATIMSEGVLVVDVDLRRNLGVATAPVCPTPHPKPQTPVLRTVPASRGCDHTHAPCTAGDAGRHNLNMPRSRHVAIAA